MAKAKDNPHKFLLRLAPATFKGIKAQAEQEKRTVNAQIEIILERWLAQLPPAR